MKLYNIGVTRQIQSVAPIFFERGEKLNLGRYHTVLDNLGFTNAEATLYIRLLRLGTSAKDKRIQLLTDRRKKLLEEIYIRENQLQEIDYLRYELQNEG